MTKERELLRRALEDWDFSDKLETLDPIFEDIRTYLSTSDDAENPVLYWYKFLDEDGYEDECFLAGPSEDNAFLNAIQVTPLYLHPPRPEPEANCYGDGNVYRGVRSKDSEVKTVYVKTAEPARKPMTEEEILELYNQCEEETSVHSTIFHFDKFARAIEARGIVLRPLNKKQIEKAFEDTGYAKGDSRQTCFIQGIRYAEKHHGIGESNDTRTPDE